MIRVRHWRTQLQRQHGIMWALSFLICCLAPGSCTREHVPLSLPQRQVQTVPSAHFDQPWYIEAKLLLERLREQQRQLIAAGVPFDPDRSIPCLSREQVYFLILNGREIGDELWELCLITGYCTDKFVSGSRTMLSALENALDDYEYVIETNRHSDQATLQKIGLDRAVKLLNTNQWWAGYCFIRSRADIGVVAFDNCGPWDRILLSETAQSRVYRTGKQWYESFQATMKWDAEREMFTSSTSGESLWAIEEFRSRGG